MYLFYCVTHSGLKEIGRRGIDVSRDGSQAWFEDLASAEAACSGAILVVRRAAFDSATRAELNDERKIPASAVVNVNPFVPPRRIDAGGGFIVRSGSFEPEILLIFRRGKWDLPKGKLNDGETVQECALREVREELGISRVRLVAPLGQTLHGYRERNRYRIKTTHWYLMKTPELRFSPQSEEDIERVEWMAYSSAIDVVGYQTLVDHMRRVKPLVFELVDW